MTCKIDEISQIWNSFILFWVSNIMYFIFENGQYDRNMYDGTNIICCAWQQRVYQFQFSLFIRERSWV